MACLATAAVEPGRTRAGPEAHVRSFECCGRKHRPKFGIIHKADRATAAAILSSDGYLASLAELPKRRTEVPVVVLQDNRGA